MCVLSLKANAGDEKMPHGSSKGRYRRGKWSQLNGMNAFDVKRNGVKVMTKSDEEALLLLLLYSTQLNNHLMKKHPY